MVMPRPELTLLTGGYRKVPVLQAGADVYCDTRLIARELERRHPAPPLFAAGGEGLGIALASWSDRTFFEPGAALAMALNRAVIPQEVIDDRKGFFNFMDFDHLEAETPHMLAQFRASLALIERMFADGRSFLLGETASFADIDAWFPVWMARGNFGIADTLLAPFPRLLAWESRMRAIGHGVRSELDARESLAIARWSDPLPAAGVDVADPQEFRRGDRVTVTPDDYGRIPVEGELVTLSIDEVSIRRASPETGAVVVHFPRLGYRVTRVARNQG